MRREIEPYPGMKVAPTLTSNIGRADQRFTADGGRMTECAVVTRPKSEGGGFLLISTSKLDRQEFTLPKGGWDHGESVHRATRREVREEGGVRLQFSYFLIWSGLTICVVARQVEGAFVAALADQQVGEACLQLLLDAGYQDLRTMAGEHAPPHLGQKVRPQYPY